MAAGLLGLGSMQFANGVNYYCACSSLSTCKDEQASPVPNHTCRCSSLSTCKDEQASPQPHLPRTPSPQPPLQEKRVLELERMKSKAETACKKLERDVLAMKQQKVGHLVCASAGSLSVAGSPVEHVQPRSALAECR